MIKIAVGTLNATRDLNGTVITFGLRKQYNDQWDRSGPGSSESFKLATFGYLAEQRLSTTILVKSKWFSVC